MRFILFFLFMFFLSIGVHGQFTITGIVVDSVSLEPLPETSIKLKKSGRGTTTDFKGRFQITTNGFDTLVFSRVGYQTYEYAVLDSEKDILILIREEVRKLKEVVVDVYDNEKPVHSAPRVVQPLSVGEGIFSPFTYFSKAEKEKRVLVRFQKEQQRVQVFVDLITREGFKYEMMDIFKISEDQYYEILARFNTERRDAHYLNDEELIRKQLMGYFEKVLSKEPAE